MPVVFYDFASILSLLVDVSAKLGCVACLTGHLGFRTGPSQIHVWGAGKLLSGSLNVTVLGLVSHLKVR